MVLSPKDLDLSSLTFSTLEESIDSKLKLGQYIRHGNTLDVHEPNLGYITYEERLQLAEKYIQAGWKNVLILQYAVSGYILHLTIGEENETNPS